MVQPYAQCAGPREKFTKKGKKISPNRSIYGYEKALLLKWGFLP
jgi:hypothetical protein